MIPSLLTKHELMRRSDSELKGMCDLLGIDWYAFTSKNDVYEEIIRKTDESIKTNKTMCSKEHTDNGNSVFTREHPDGRKDVEITVKTIDVEVSDEATAKAKETIEGEVFEKLSKAKVLVTVINKDNGDFASMVVSVNHVRNYAEAVVTDYKAKHPIASIADFIIHEYHIDNETVKISHL